MNAIIFKLFVPHHFPLFRERSFRLGSGTSIAIQRKFYTGDSMYRIKYDISTAGYSASRTGEFIKRGQELSLYWLKPSVCAHWRQFVGWVERSDTHQLRPERRA